MDKLSSYLLSSKIQTPPEDLKRFGLEAAAAFLRKEASLNEAVAARAKEHSLNPYQVQRVVETANHAVFRTLFEKQASKVVEFPVADPEVIRGMVAKNTGYQESTSCPEPQAYVQGGGAAGNFLEAMFGKLGTHEKTAQAAPARDLNKAWVRIHESIPGAQGDLELAKEHVKEAGAAFLKEVRQTLRTGEATLQEVFDAVSQVAENQSLVKMALAIVTKPLAQEGTLTLETKGYDKKAHAQADTDHPVLQAFGQLQKSVADVYLRKQALAELTEGLDRTRTALRAFEGIHAIASQEKVAAFNIKEIGRHLGLLKREMTHGKDWEIASKLVAADKAKNPAAAAAAGFKDLAHVDRGPELGQLMGHHKATAKPDVAEYAATRLGKGLGFAGAGAAGLGALHVAGHGADKVKERREFGKGLRQALEANPDLAKLDKDTLGKHFKTLYKFAPSVATDPVSAGSFLRMSSQRSDIGIDPKTIESLANISKLRAETGDKKGVFPSALRLAGWNAGLSGG